VSKKPIRKISFGGEKPALGRFELDFAIDYIVVEAKFNIGATVGRLRDFCIAKFDIGATLARL